MGEAAQELAHERLVVVEKDEHQKRVEKEEANHEDAIHVRVEEEKELIEVSVVGQFVEIRAVVVAFARLLATTVLRHDDHIYGRRVVVRSGKRRRGRLACSGLWAARQVRDHFKSNVLAVFEAYGRIVKWKKKLSRAGRALVVVVIVG